MLHRPYRDSCETAEATSRTFYIVALALVGLYWFGTTTNTAGGMWPYFMPLMQRCALAFVLFTIVMFVGVLDESSPLRARLMPIRRQLSILGCIFALGHLAFYGVSYVPRLGSALNGNLGFSLALAALLVLLMAILLVTSFQVVKRRMSAARWKGVQRLAYPFYLLTYVHLLLMLAPSALHGGVAATTSVAVYSIVFAAYVVLRLVRARRIAVSAKPSDARGEARGSGCRPFREGESTAS